MKNKKASEKLSTETSNQYHFKSKTTDLYLVATEHGLSSCTWKKQSAPMVKNLTGTTAQVKHLAKASKQLTEYFAKKRTHFDLHIDIEGTDFQIKVWKELAKIPFGTTTSYAGIAKKIKNSKAVRAVGSANGKNPLCIIVPCHRVINADGKLGGYAGGLNIKKALLGLEQV